MAKNNSIIIICKILGFSLFPFVIRWFVFSNEHLENSTNIVYRDFALAAFFIDGEGGKCQSAKSMVHAVIVAKKNFLKKIEKLKIKILREKWLRKVVFV